MKISKKWFLIIGLLLALPLPIYILWNNNTVWQSYLGLKLPDIVAINNYLAWYLIIVSAIVLVILIVWMIVLLCWPTRNKYFLIHKQDGHVKLTSKAINGFISASLADLPYLDHPKISSKLTQRRLRINISGNLAPSENIQQQLQTYLQQLEQDLRQLLGIEQKPKIEIRFNNFSSESSSKQRVD
ncbi:alkaline shock response membrane anchor protein AmaP [Bombilactobacillus folatiphilus]|uniref:Alkaline shock response membrane anchor protein AmaP n=1 Tax=Bombilactobacillus folatiphilus TaxID=2923362 RepID=A0ABY4P961_9LACO|nr:alkaline shock response membrane anchor protein AmaP [Bombilactobacillus folatiphilus]UQS82071.1 alkaline shock response membrane anchor protein AmaP [Bombilactobacillus folatiphilus]